jgi:hypothetical protein
MIAGRRSLLLLALVAALALGLWACSVWRGEPSKGRLIFPHAQHVKEADCADCHAGVEKSRTATAGKFIAGGHGACDKCHEEEVKARCDKCHRGARSGIRLSRPDRGLSFSHAAHTKTPCKSCHLEGKEPGALVPGHATCNTASCHRAAYKASRCGSCHRDLQRYRLKPVTALKHGPGFATAHGGMARQNIRSCAQCHDQSYCAECHAARTAAATPSILFPEKVDRGFIHRGDYLTRHALEARADQGTCFKCHGQRGCRACHALNGLAAPPDTQRPGGVTRRQHPGGWMTAGSGEHHGRKARQDIARCASCHDRGAQSNCVGCHRVGGSGGSPHPRGWSWRNKSSVCASTAVCATCHPAGRGCR